jgi:hypothetical protein
VLQDMKLKISNVYTGQPHTITLSSDGKSLAQGMDAEFFFTDSRGQPIGAFMGATQHLCIYPADLWTLALFVLTIGVEVKDLPVRGEECNTMQWGLVARSGKGAELLAGIKACLIEETNATLREPLTPGQERAVEPLLAWSAPPLPCLTGEELHYCAITAAGNLLGDGELQEQLIPVKQQANAVSLAHPTNPKPASAAQLDNAARVYVVQMMMQGKYPNETPAPPPSDEEPEQDLTLITAAALAAAPKLTTAPAGGIAAPSARMARLAALIKKPDATVPAPQATTAPSETNTGSAAAAPGAGNTGETTTLPRVFGSENLPAVMYLPLSTSVMVSVGLILPR